MKVLQILPSLEVGGVERGVLDLVRAMKKRGDESVVISSGGELVAELQKLGIPHYSLPVHKKSIFSLSLIPKIAEVIERERIDLVHARSRVPAWLAWLAARKTARPFVTTCHGYYSHHLLSHVMGWGKRVIVISRVIGRHMIDDFGVAPDRISLIHRGVDLSQFPFRSTQYDPHREAKPRPFRVINIGRFSPIKGQVEFLKAVHQAWREVPNLEVWLVGSEAKGKRKYTDLIERTIRQLGLGHMVKLLGTRRDIPELLWQSDLLVLSTLVPEAFGRVVIEAGAVGTPVVATKVGGVLDIIDSEDNGMLVPPGDIHAMAEAMVHLLKDREKAQAFAVKLRAKVEQQFTLDEMVEKTLAVYREAKDEKKILVIKLGAVGDVILAVPSLRMLRERFPKATISLLVDRKFSSLVSVSPYLDDVIPIDRERLHEWPYLFRLAKRLRREGFDVSVDLQNSKWTHLLAILSGIGERSGFRRGMFGFLLNRADWTYHVTDAPVKHQFRVLSKLGVRKLDETLELWPDSEAEKRAAEILPNGSAASQEKLVGLVLGSSPKWPTKRWPLENFQKLSERLIQELKCRIVLIGSSEEEGWTQPLAAANPDSVINLVGKTSLLDLVSVIKRLNVLVTGDTAPLHVAGAMNTKIVALFGPTDSKRHMPPSNGSIVLQRSLACQPCYRGVCHNPEKLACLTHISVKEVFEAVARQLAC